MKTRDEIAGCEMIPFKAGIAAGTAVITATTVKGGVTGIPGAPSAQRSGSICSKKGQVSKTKSGLP